MSGKSLSALYHNLNLFYIFHSSPSSPSFQLPSVCINAHLLQATLLGGGGGERGDLNFNLFEINYIIYDYYAEWKVINHPVRGGIPTSSATHDIYTRYT